MTRLIWKMLVWASLLSMMASLIGADTLRTEAQPVPVVDANLFLTLFPALRTAPAPEWLRQGTRLTYYTIAGIIGGGKHKYVEDPNCKNDPKDKNDPHYDPNGCWVHPITKKKYRQIQVGGAAGGSGGHGYTQVNVALLNRGVALLNIRSYGIPDTGMPPVIFGEGGTVEVPGAGGDFWLNPDALRGITAANLSALQIFLGPYELKGRRYTAVWVHSETAAWVYDPSTGVLLHGSNYGHGGDIQGPIAQGDTRQGAMFVGQNTLLDVRTMHLPWASESAPDWVARVRALRYQGYGGVHVPGSPYVPVPIATTYERHDGGPNWARYRQTIVQKAAPGLPPNSAQVELVFGPAQLGGLWIAPRALAQLRSGQIVDTDPVTRVTASVGRIGRTPSGRMAVTITESGAGEQIDYAYDASSGMLLAVHRLIHRLNYETQMSLVSAQ